MIMVRFARSIGVSSGLVLLALCNTPAANAEFVVAYKAANVNGPIASEQRSGITALSLTRSAKIDASDSGNEKVFQSDKWNNQTFDPDNADEFLSWGFTATTAPMSLTNLQVNVSRSDVGPQFGLIRANVNGQGFVDIRPEFTISPVDPTDPPGPLTVDLSSSGLFSRVSSVEFRLFAYSASNQGTNGELNITDLSSGASDFQNFGIFVAGIQAVPEPTSLALIGVCAAGAGFRWRTKRRGAAAKQHPLVG